MGRSLVARTIRNDTRSIGTRASSLNMRYDRIGNVRRMTQNDITSPAGGWVTSHNETLPFGEPWITQDWSWDQVARSFRGSERDGETRLHHMGARYYDASEARWTSADPALSAFTAGGEVYDPRNLAAYSYAFNSPVSYWDPTGLMGEPASRGPSTTPPPPPIDDSPIATSICGGGIAARPCDGGHAVIEEPRPGPNAPSGGNGVSDSSGSLDGASKQARPASGTQPLVNEYDPRARLPLAIRLYVQSSGQNSTSEQQRIESVKRDVLAAIPAMNRIWRQADIQFSIDRVSVIRSQSPSLSSPVAAEGDRAYRSDDRQRRAYARSIGTLPAGTIAIVVGELPSVPHVGGLAYTNTVSADAYRNNLSRIAHVARRSGIVGPSGSTAIANTLGFVLSHESGHMLGISHEFSPSPALMRARPSTSDARLDPIEVRRARGNAELIRTSEAHFVRP